MSTKDLLEREEYEDQLEFFSFPLENKTQLLLNKDLLKVVLGSKEAYTISY